jgi:hypothetical protein
MNMINDRIIRVKLGKLILIYAVMLLLIFSQSSISPVHSIRARGVITSPLGNTPIIDGQVGQDEWNDANEVQLTSGDIGGFMRTKHDSENLYVLLEFTSDTVRHPQGFDNGWVGIDAKDNGASSPQDDDFLFMSSGRRFYLGNGTGWAVIERDQEHRIPGVQGWEGAKAFGISPYSNQPHAINEFKIPLKIVANAMSFGFSVAMTDLDGRKVVEWPAGGGTTWDFWVGPGTPAGAYASPDKWGTIELLSTSMVQNQPFDYTIILIAISVIAIISIISIYVKRRERASSKPFEPES